MTFEEDCDVLVGGLPTPKTKTLLAFSTERQLREKQSEIDIMKAETARLRGENLESLDLDVLEKTYAELQQSAKQVEAKIARRHAENTIAKSNDLFVCPISGALMQDPVVAADGYTYDRSCIVEWFAKSSGGVVRSPSTNLALDSTNLTPNRSLKSAIQEAVDREVSGKKRPRISTDEV